MSSQVNTWVHDYIEQMFINRGYDPASEEVEKILDAQQENWKRLMVMRGLNKDQNLAQEVAFEFSLKKIVSGPAKIFEQFAEFLNARPKAVADSEYNSQKDLQRQGYEKCEVCEGIGAVGVPVFEKGAGLIYIEDMDDAKNFVKEGLVRLESFELEQRIDKAMIHPMVMVKMRWYFMTHMNEPLTREDAHALLVEATGYMNDRRRPTQYRVVERSHGCSCISGLKYAGLKRLTPTQEEFVRDRVKQADARISEWERERGISTVSDDEHRRTWREWFDREKAKGGMFRSVRDERSGEFLESQVNHKLALDMARQLTAAIRQREVLTHDIPDGWEVVIYTGGTFLPCEVRGGYYQPHPQARVQKIRPDQPKAS